MMHATEEKKSGGIKSKHFLKGVYRYEMNSSLLYNP